MTNFTEFFSDDAGAITIDWVVLTAGILLMGILVTYAILNNGVQTMASNLNTGLDGSTTNVVLGEIVLPETPPLEETE